jgi:hypothetical protein
VTVARHGDGRRTAGASWAAASTQQHNCDTQGRGSTANGCYGAKYNRDWACWACSERGEPGLRGMGTSLSAPSAQLLGRCTQRRGEGARGLHVGGSGLLRAAGRDRREFSRAQGSWAAKLAGGAAIVAALGTDEGLQRHDESTRQGKRERMGASSPRRRIARRCARESDDGTVQGGKGREDVSSPRRRGDSGRNAARSASGG